MKATKVKKAAGEETKPLGTSQDILKDLTLELLNLMGTPTEVRVVFDQENDCYSVTIEAGDTTGLLIGRKGETLTSIQTILGILLKQKTGQWERVAVNVGDYREKEEDYLKSLAISAANRARETGQPQSLYNLNPAQRRIVHMTLSQDSGVVTESVGDGAERYLVVKVK